MQQYIKYNFTSEEFSGIIPGCCETKDLSQTLSRTGTSRLANFTYYSKASLLESACVFLHPEAMLTGEGWQALARSDEGPSCNMTTSIDISGV